MPELPEVEMFRRYFERHALGQTIARIRVLDDRILGTRKIAQLRGRQFAKVTRHGKHLFAWCVFPSRDDGVIASRDDGVIASRDDGVIASRDDGVIPSREDGVIASREDGVIPSRED